jgi:integrase/recombinase XerD
MTRHSPTSGTGTFANCAEAGATAASLKLKRNELLWIAARLGPDASQGIDIETLQRIATERQ